MKKCVLLLFIVTSLQGCANEEKSIREKAAIPVYKREREFTFAASHFNDKGGLSQLNMLVLTTSSEFFSEEYGQIRSSWTFIGKNWWERSYSGIEESDTAVWIHPPRSGIYSKLELSPFPMIKYPLEVGNKWTWSLLVGNHYSVKGHAEWGDNDELFVSNYQITRKIPISTKLGMIDCYEIDSFTENRFEQTELKAYYSTNYGFVRLEYLNIDKEPLTIELVKEKTIQPDLKHPFKEL